jgi:two-component system, LytTR family, sensor kinase
LGSGLPYSYPRILLAFFICWIIGAVVQCYVLFQFGLILEIAVKDSLVSMGLLSLFGLVTMNMYRFYQPGKSNKIYRFLFGVVIAALYSFVLKYTLAYTIQGNPEYNVFFERSLTLRFIVAFLVISFITVINWMMNSINEQKEKEKQQATADAMLREAELARLRQQLQPHFLFNSLNSINALIGSKPNEARQMVLQLSDFLRGTLKKDDQKLVSLKEEVEHLKLYLEIEKVRFGHRLKTEIELSEESLSGQLPPLLLQPVVENAIKFGLYDTTGEITISLTARTEGNSLLLEVQNPFDPVTQGANKGTGFGLSSIKRRLYLLYARNDLISTGKTENIFITKLRIPQ